MKLVDTVFQAGQHAIIYGERGVGKTSLSITLRQKVFPVSTRVKFFEAKCLTSDSFADMWARLMISHKWSNGDHALDDIDDTLDPYLVKRLCEKFSAGQLPVFIFDEFDRLQDDTARLAMAETIKLLSDDCPQATILLIGIGRTIKDLLDDHQSVRRALRQVEMPRMSPTEVLELVELRLSKAGMTISPQTMSDLTIISRGMPGYAHLLGMHAAKAAIAQQTLFVDADHLWNSLREALDEAEDIVKQEYRMATQSVQPGNQLKEALLACALADVDEFGSFTASSVVEPFQNIMDAPKGIPDFNRHLNKFCSAERGKILERHGSQKNYHYKFKDAMMQCYVIMRGISDGLIEKNVLASNRHSQGFSTFSPPPS